MHFKRLHPWNVSIAQAREIQLGLAGQIVQRDSPGKVGLIAGVDVSVQRSGEAVAAAVILSFPDLKLVEKEVLKTRVSFPYVPGFLSFREVPITLDIMEKLSHVPDLVMVDGQGRAHPRHCGLASHLGLCLNIPTIGCAKSPLFGHYQEPGEAAGSFTFILDDEGESIGAVLRTRQKVRPLYISVGHKITLLSAVDWVLRCCRGVRIPEPTRLVKYSPRCFRHSFTSLLLLKYGSNMHILSP